MSKTFSLLAIVLVIIGVGTAVSANELVNGSFETGSLSGWSQSIMATNYTIDYPADEAQDGTKAFRWYKAYYYANSPENKIWQTISATPGLYNITFTGSLKRYAMNKYDGMASNWVYATIELLVDNVVIWSKTVNGTVGTNGWEPFSYTTPVPVQINQNRTVRLRWGLTQEGIYNQKNWDVVLADAWNLQTTPAITYTPYDLKNLKGQANGVSAQVDNLIVTATSAEAGAYYAETTDRSQGIRIESTGTATVGQKVTVKGTLQTKATGERYLANAAFSNAVTSTEPKPVMMLSSAVGGAAFGTIPAVPGSKGPHNTALAVKIAGAVTVKAADSSYIMISDGSLSDNGIKVDTSRVPSASVPGVGDVVSVSGISSIYSDGSIKPLIIARRASDISSDLNP